METFACSSQSAARRMIQIRSAVGPVIGDYTRVEQHFHDVGAPAVLQRDDVLGAFQASSSMLRKARNTVANIHLERAEVEQILTWIQIAAPMERLAMLLDQPGAGKTVVMRDVLERLEAQDLPVLAIKADLLSGISSQLDLADRLGLPGMLGAGFFDRGLGVFD